MNCPECGIALEPDAKFCPKCYARIEPPSLWRKFLSLFQSTGKPARRIVNIRKTVTIKTTDKDGVRHEYHSLAKAPPALREEIAKLESEALKENLSVSSSEGDASKIISRKNVSVYKIKDASGNERFYHSLDELPPEIRAAVERVQGFSSAVLWQGKTVRVRANLVPRFLWTTSSIDVYLDGECVFRTGGKLASIGSHAADVRIGGSEHQMEVSWGRSRNFRFPFQLKIDGNLVLESLVEVENRPLMLIPSMIIFAVMFSVAIVLYLLFRSARQHFVGG